jgi:hypothetical protein
MEKNHVENLNDEDKKKWLKQRGWMPEGPATWRDPDTGMSFGFAASVEKARKTCRLPYDFELHP